MGFKNRELEVKVLVSGARTIAQVDEIILKIVEDIYPDYEEIDSKSYDLYWHTPKDSKADFVRLRRSDNGVGAQITLKSTDRDDNTDRVEIDLEVGDHKQSLALLSGLFGEYTKLSKRYIVYFLENDDTTISIYQITGDDQVFIEVEARTLKRLKSLLKTITEKCEKYELFRIDRSLYDMFICKKTPNKTPLSEFLERL